MKQVKISRVATAALVIGSVIGAYFFSGPRKKRSSTEIVPEYQDELDTNLITPANATFGVVWSTIYAGVLGQAVHQALPSQANNPRYERAAPWLVANFVLNGLFSLFFSKGEKPARVAANATTLASLPTVLALHRSLCVGETNVPEPERTFQKAVGIYAGWITVATGVATTNLLIEGGWRESRERAVPYAVGLMTVLSGIGVAISKRLNDPYFLLPFAAGFTGIAAKQKGRNDAVAVAAGTLAVASIAVFVQRLQAAKQVLTQPRQNKLTSGKKARRQMAQAPEYIDLD